MANHAGRLMKIMWRTSLDSAELTYSCYFSPCWTSPCHFNVEATTFRVFFDSGHVSNFGDIKVKTPCRPVTYRADPAQRVPGGY